MPLKDLRRRFGIAAPRVTVRPQVPWYWRSLSIVLLVSVFGFIAWWLFETGRQVAGFSAAEAAGELQRLRELSGRLARENEELRARTARAEGELHMERAAQEDLARQIKALIQENAQLKEDLAFFESLTSGVGPEARLAVRRFTLERDIVPGEFRYSLLLVQAPGHAKQFRGRLQFMVRIRQNGREEVITLPGPDAQDSSAFHLSFKLFQRVEGRFKVPPGATVESLQVQVFREGRSDALVTETTKLS